MTDEWLSKVGAAIERSLAKQLRIAEARKGEVKHLTLCARSGGATDLLVNASGGLTVSSAANMLVQDDARNVSHVAYVAVVQNHISCS